MQAEGKEARLEGNERQVLVKDLRDALRRGVAGGDAGQAVEQRQGDVAHKVDVQAVVQALAGIGCDAIDVGVALRDKVDGGDVGDGLALCLDHEMQCDAVLAQVVDAEQWCQHVFGVLVEHEDLEGFLIGACWCSVEVQHAHQAIWMTCVWMGV